MRRRGRVLIIAAAAAVATVAVIVIVPAVMAAVDRHHEYQRSLIEREIGLAQPFLALDENAKLQLGYPDPDPHGLSGYGYVVVRFETDDPDTLVRDIQSVLRSEGWRAASEDRMHWHLGWWAIIDVEGHDVSVFIGVIEG